MVGKTMKTIGSKAEVFHQSAKKTSGGLTKKDLMKHKGRIISRKKHAAGKKAIKHLFALGYKPTKGKFTLMRRSMVDGRRKTHKKHSTRRRRGGASASPGVPAATSGTGLAAGSHSK
jgi:hypothetical protein